MTAGWLGDEEVAKVLYGLPVLYGNGRRDLLGYQWYYFVKPFMNQIAVELCILNVKVSFQPINNNFENVQSFLDSLNTQPLPLLGQTRSVFQDLSPLLPWRLCTNEVHRTPDKMTFETT